GLFTHFKRHPAVIGYYLTHLVLSNIGYSSEEFTSSPAHVMDGFKCSVVFSATPLPKISHPSSLKSTRYDEHFETQVLAQSAKIKNQKFIFPQTVDDFFFYVAKHRQEYTHVRHMIDAGGFLCDEENHVVAKKWLDASELDGVIYFKDSVNSYEEKFCFCLKNSTIEIDFIRQEELRVALSQHHLELDTLKVGVFFDAAHAESAHFDPQPKTAAFLFAGDSLTLSHAIQAIMRERGFLNDEIDQQIIWVVQKNLKAKMHKGDKPFRSSHIHTWCLINEVKAKKQGIIMAGFQEIAFKIEQFCFLAHSDAHLYAIKQHAGGFREKCIPQAAWESQKKLAKTDVVLWEFARGQYGRFDFEILFEENSTLKETIAVTINQVHEKVSHIFKDFKANAASEIHQKSVIKKQLCTVQYKHHVSAVVPEPLTKHVKISDKDYPIAMQEHITSVRKIFNTPHLTENFYIESNQINTAKKNDIHLKENFLKTIDFILIVIHKGNVWAEVIANDMLPSYIKNLKKRLDDKAIQHQAFIIRADGVLYLKGKGALAPETTTLTNIMASDWLKDILFDVALLQGKFLYNDRFKERIRNWPDFLEFVNKILKSLPLKKEISSGALLSYLQVETGSMY
ncbi:MAG TPA: hypothetical protein VIH61_09370, partial [Waddliaceae bacterium]